MKTFLSFLVPALLLGACSTLQSSRDTAPRYSGNPVVPGDFADPSILVYKDTFYIYATTGGEATVWRSPDFFDWKLTRLAWPTSMGLPDIWAPAVRQGRDGKFYMYTSTNHNIYAGVADHPAGPFRNILGGDSIFIKNRQWWNPMHSIDADVFIDDDGEAYLYWGSGFDFKDGVCAVGRLGNDMASFKEPPQLITPEGYFEGPHMLKRDGLYYLMYSDGLYYDSTYKVRYAVSKSPLGPFVQGKNSPILKSTPDGRVSGPGHHYTFRHEAQDYIVYHRHTYPFYKGIRQVCIDSLNFEGAGVIKAVIPTQTGVPLTFTKREPKESPQKPVAVTASSATGEAYSADKAFDGSFGTLWATQETAVPASLTADFGREITIRKCTLFFDQVMGAYPYKIEYSGDGASWQLFAEGNNGTVKEWPVSHQKEAKGRYVKVTIQNGGKRERLGLWEVRVF